MTEPDPHDILELEDLRALRQNNPRQLFKHLEQMRQEFLFGVEEDRETEWGGVLRVLLNRNLLLHLVPAFTDAMPDATQLPQFCVMPDEMRADQVQVTETALDDEETIQNVVFFVDPDEFDAICRSALQVAEAYPGWDVIPDSYFLRHELVQFVRRTVLPHPVVAAERRFDFRLGLVGGDGPPPLDEEDLPPEALISPEPRPEDDEEGEDGLPPLRGMRTHPVEWGGDAEGDSDWEA